MIPFMILKNRKTILTILIRFLLVIMVAALAASGAAAQNNKERADRIQNQVESIALASGIEGRRAAIIERIEGMGLESTITRFDPPVYARVDRPGANITAELPGQGPTVLLLGAHYDSDEAAQGVIDNAAGVAAVLDLAEAFLEKPMQNIKIAIAFFDLEEDGLLGSRAMVADSLNSPLPDIFLNFDVFGYGDGLWIGAENPDGLLPQLIRDHGKAKNLEAIADSIYPPSDHISFRQTRTDSYGISLLDASDIYLLLELFQTGSLVDGKIPRILTIIHTKEDTMDKLDAEAVARGIGAIEQALRQFDLHLEHSGTGLTGNSNHQGWQINAIP